MFCIGNQAFSFDGLGVPQSNNPKIHSFRVVSAREAAVNDIDLLSPSSITATNTSTGNNISVSPEKISQQLSKTSSTSNQTKIHKPILMCFICKLSFGNTKSFTLHASTEHQLNLQEPEKLLLSREYSSAILQRNNDEKPQLSFLEPLEQQQQQSPSLISMKQQQELQQKLINDFVQQIQKQAIAANSNNNNDHQQQINDQSTAMLLNNSSSSSLIKSPNHLAHNSSSSSNNTSSTSPSSSSHAKHNNNSGTDNSSSANNNTNNNLTNSSSSVMNSQQQQSSSLNQQNSPSSSSTSSAVANNNSTSSSATATQQQQLLASTNAAAAAKLLSEFLHQQQQQFQRSLQCSEHQGLQGVDCKNCEMLNIGLRSPLTPSKSPNSSVGGDMNLTSPTTSTPLPQSSGGTHLNLSPGAPSFTIGACPEHINGRPIGVECAR